jgi:hypothetical protein
VEYIDAGSAACAVVQYLPCNFHFSTEMDDERFISAAEGGHFCFLPTRQQISAEVDLQVPKATSAHTAFQTLKDLTGRLSDETRIQGKGPS